MENTASPSKSWQIPVILLAIFLSFFLFYFWHRGAIAFTFWDESIYVNAARAYLSSVKPFPNPEHPLLGKQIIAIGIRLFGDNPTGWRFFSIAFGALASTTVAYLVWVLTRRIGVMFFVAVLMVSDPLLYVHFRMGLLDSSLTAFLLLVAAFACRFSLAPSPRLTQLIPLSLALGLALSVKLLTLFIIPLVLALVLYRLYRVPIKRKDCLPAALILLGLPPVLLIGGYLIQGYTFGEAYDLLIFNFSWHSTAKSWDPITSRWYEWLYIGNPLWYFNRPVEGGRIHAILATGNLILWVGAEILALYALFRKWRQPEVLFLAFVILAQFGIYFRKPHTYIHYMTEIVPFLYILMGVGIADLFDRYEDRYRRILQVDFALFGMVSFLAFWNYWPFISGQPVTRDQFQKVAHWKIPEPNPTPKPAPSPSPVPK